MKPARDANGVEIVGGATVVRRQNSQAFNEDAPTARVLIPGALRSLIGWVGGDFQEKMAWVANKDLAVVVRRGGTPNG
jgi:hypothetical protein